MRRPQLVLTALCLISLLGFLSSLTIYANDTKVKNLIDQRRWQDRSVLNITLNATEFIELRRRGNVTLVDTRRREDFSRGHLLGAINIPIYELAMRFSSETDRNKTIILYCGSSQSCEQGAVIAGKPTFCGLALREINQMSPNQRVRILTGLIPDFPQAGLTIESSDYSFRVAYLNE
ncbi:rhodanese-like domain-containing protein [uncultured Xanthomonas sp.]|uniref:rhodanese-like domain-containing protein n=1 Tax=uncultured Xanthomonas sp. TaxID=152831 RepID=UPI0025F54CAB|nr:rhodanese-like domain-containing protein [uncultured Xanthomonas sp.]